MQRKVAALAIVCLQTRLIRWYGIPLHKLLPISDRLLGGWNWRVGVLSLTHSKAVIHLSVAQSHTLPRLVFSIARHRQRATSTAAGCRCLQIVCRRSLRWRFECGVAELWFWHRTGVRWLVESSRKLLLNRLARGLVARIGLFVRDVGLTPRDYHQQQQLVYARRALADRQVPIKRIAYHLGFKQPSHFSAWFRRAIGRSPRMYRQLRLHPGEAVV